MSPYETFRHHLSNQDKWEIIGFPVGILALIGGVLGLFIWGHTNLFVLLVLILSILFLMYASHRFEEAKRQTTHALRKFLHANDQTNTPHGGNAHA